MTDASDLDLLSHGAHLGLQEGRGGGGGGDRCADAPRRRGEDVGVAVWDHEPSEGALRVHVRGDVEVAHANLEFLALRPRIGIPVAAAAASKAALAAAAAARAVPERRGDRRGGQRRLVEAALPVRGAVAGEALLAPAAARGS